MLKRSISLQGQGGNLRQLTRLIERINNIERISNINSSHDGINNRFSFLIGNYDSFRIERKKIITSPMTTYHINW